MWFAALLNEPGVRCFSALQRAEIAEIRRHAWFLSKLRSFSALQRAEIAEMRSRMRNRRRAASRFSALQRAEIAEINRRRRADGVAAEEFQCSSTSRNC